MNWTEMKVGMELIGDACRESMRKGGCDNCLFDTLCNIINRNYWNNNFHDMKETMEEVLKKSGYSYE